MSTGGKRGKGAHLAAEGRKEGNTLKEGKQRCAKGGGKGRVLTRWVKDSGEVRKQAFTEILASETGKGVECARE
eukprot:3936315-Rhodomonas_salina.2